MPFLSRSLAQLFSHRVHLLRQYFDFLLHNLLLNFEPGTFFHFAIGDGNDALERLFRMLHLSQLDRLSLDLGGLFLHRSTQLLDLTFIAADLGTRLSLK